jgi:hypothetical protein
MATISLEGLASGIAGEERAVAYVKVDHNGQTYDWKVFVPPMQDLSLYLQSVTDAVAADIDAKETAWAALTPKTREIEDPLTGETIVEEIQKGEIVRADDPDYYAKRRVEYPPLAEQLDAFWKGGQAQADMLAKIQAVKNKYPKP